MDLVARSPWTRKEVGRWSSENFDDFCHFRIENGFIDFVADSLFELHLSGGRLRGVLLSFTVSHTRVGNNMSSSFTSGFETLYVGDNIRKRGAKKSNATSLMFGNSVGGCLSEGTASLVASLAAKSGLSKYQMKKLGSLTRRSGHKPTVTKMRSFLPQVKKERPKILFKKPLRRPKSKILHNLRGSGEDVCELRRRSEKAKHMSSRRATSKSKMQNSYMTQLRVGLGCLHEKEGKRLLEASRRELADRKRSEARVQAHKFTPSELFVAISKEIDERNDFMRELEGLGKLTIDKELEIKSEIADRVRQLEVLDGIMLE